MRIKKAVIMLLIGAGLLVQGCSCDTWASFWGGDPERECAGHWRFKEKETARAAESGRQLKISPCDAPAVAKTARLYPIGETGGNAVRLEKVAPAEIRANEAFDYRIKVTNLTNQQLQNVVVKDCVSKNLEVEKSTPQVSEIKNGDAHWKLGTLEAKATKVISITAVASGKESITSCAEVFYDSPLCAKMDIVEPKLQLTKLAPSESLVCERIPVNYVVTNIGTGYACKIKIEDKLPEGLMISGGGREVVFNVDSLGPGKSQEFLAMVDARRTGDYASKAVAVAETGGKAESNMTKTVVQQPVLRVSESGPLSEYIGRSLSYEITVTNTGNGSAKNTVVEAMVPENVEFNSATLGGRFSRSSPGKVRWSLGTLEPNKSRKVTMVLQGNDAGALKTTVMAKAYCAKDVSDSVRTMLSGIPAMLLEVIDVSDPIRIGQMETYIISVTNQGSAPDTQVQISCILEAGMQYISSSGSTMASVVGNKVTFAAVPSLAPKSQAKWRLNVKAATTGDMRFKTILNSDRLARPVEETESTTFYK